MSGLLYKVLMLIIAGDIFALGILILFLINARINLKRDLKQQEVYYKAITLARIEKSSDRAADRLRITKEEFIAFCKSNNIETPETRIARMDKEHQQEEAEKKRIMEEEAAWRAEQERIIEERKKSQEEESKIRKERLRKFGFK